MRIIDIAICTDNVDPKGLSRVRCIRYSEYNVGEKEKRKYVTWGDDDPYLASPFLPLNINLIPEIGQAIKLINYNPDKETLNTEYIAGPFTNAFDLKSQTFTQQLRYTTYGTSMKENVDMYGPNGNYVFKKSEGSFAKLDDFAIYGKYGSDIVFSEDGIQLRGGKYLTKDAASDSERKKMVKYPIMSKNSSTLYLKKFAKKMVLSDVTVETMNTAFSDLKYIIEYEVDSLSAPTKVSFFVYKVLKNDGEIAKTNYFNGSTPLPAQRKLINENNDDVTPTYVINLSTIIGKEIGQEIRQIIHTLHDNSLKKINPLYTNEDLHPFYYRPTLTFLNTTPSGSDDVLKFDILSNVKFYTGFNESGMVWSQLNINPPTTITKTVKKELKKVDNSNEQSFSSLKSDKMFFLSTDTNIPGKNKGIDFNNLDFYSLTQEDYISKVEPETFSIVRGEKLIMLIKALFLVLMTHKHNPGEIPVTTGYGQYETLQKLIDTMENDLLNGSIRLN